MLLVPVGPSPPSPVPVVVPVPMPVPVVVPIPVPGVKVPGVIVPVVPPMVGVVDVPAALALAGKEQPETLGSLVVRVAVPVKSQVAPMALFLWK